jgi:proteasome lid subunit RPN8/RPN11
MSRIPNTLTPAEQDLSAIKHGDWTDREFPLGPREKPTRRQIIFKQSVLNEIYTHGRSAPDIEVCGVLVGNVYQDAMGPFVFVEACIRGNFSTGKAAQVTFTGKTWTHIQDVMDTSYPDMRILGWYHTHPGHGIFLSDMDLFIHKHFFNLPWHLAFVFDPQNQEEGLFAWRNANMAIESFVVQKDMPPIGQKVARRVPEPYVPSVQYATPGNDPAGQTPPATAAASAVAVPAPGLLAGPAMNVPPGARPAAAAEVNELSARIQTLEKRQRWVTAALALAVLVAVGWPIVLSALSILRGAEEPTTPNPILPSAPIHPSPPGANPTSASAAGTSAGKLAAEPTTRVAADDVQQH